MERFSKIASLTAFKPFANAANALEQINALSEAQLTDDLKNFLVVNLPKVGVHSMQDRWAQHSRQLATNRLPRLAPGGCECCQGGLAPANNGVMRPTGSESVLPSAACPCCSLPSLLHACLFKNTTLKSSQ